MVKRMDAAADQQEEGVAIALELIEKIKNTPGVKGMHIMAVHWEEIVPRLVEESNLPRPVNSLPEVMLRLRFLSNQMLICSRYPLQGCRKKAITLL